MPRGHSGGNPLDVSIDARDFSRVVKGAAAFDKSLGNALRKRIREAAKPLAEHAKRNINGIPSGQYHVGLRAAIAKGVAIRTDSRASGGGVRIVVSPRALKALDGGKHAGVYKAMNQAKFRHPSWGRRGAGQWHDQVGRPYFDGVDRQAREVATAAINKALIEARSAFERSK